MTLSSPNYPKWYNADEAGCEWLISAPEGFIIALEFNHFHVSNLTEVAQEVGSDRAPKIFLFHPKFRHLMG